MNTVNIGQEILRVVPPKEGQEGYIQKGRITDISKSEIEVEIFEEPTCKMRFGRSDGQDLLGKGSFIVSPLQPSSIKLAGADVSTYIEKIKELATRVPHSTARRILGDAISELNNEIDNIENEHLYADDEYEQEISDSGEKALEFLVELVLESAKKADYALDEALEFIRKSNDRLNALPKK